MDIGIAVQGLNQNKKVSREKWNGTKYLQLSEVIKKITVQVQKEVVIEGETKTVTVDEEQDVVLHKNIYVAYLNIIDEETTEVKGYNMYVPTASDVLANDWYIIVED